MAILPKESKNQRALLVLLAAIAAAGVFWNYWVTPKKQELLAQEERLEALESRNQAAQVLAVRGGANIEENLATFERHVRRLEQLVPAADEVPQLIFDVNAVARELEVEPLTFTPSPAQPSGAYTRHSYAMAWVGEYHDIGAFMARIASLSRIITPTELSLEVYDGQVDYADMDYPVTASFTLVTYALPDPAELAARMEAEQAAPGGDR